MLPLQQLLFDPADPISSRWLVAMRPKTFRLRFAHPTKSVPSLRTVVLSK